MVNFSDTLRHEASRIFSDSLSCLNAELLFYADGFANSCLDTTATGFFIYESFHSFWDSSGGLLRSDRGNAKVKFDLR
ncbi:hypothetical protein [Synechococcus sp. PCC 6312]|uniref:hypothetical protein n=1 Tax=Synechococcus sp. (strain ATCC 27167 / PCC 6312) TaxID=195253 RepID=UPI00029F0487|nr:hypothetical protein [Synechococcus sp. PCC 6312]AFY60141.1 hypothetical protein Syn6312_0939 [Synechococcus sp. PCC 6312]